MIRRTIVRMMCLACVAAAGATAYGWRPSDYRATIHAPPEVRLDKTRQVPIPIEVMTPDGQPFSGQIEVWPGYGRFVESETTSVSVMVQRGRADVVVSLDHVNDPGVEPLRLSATRGDEVLALAEVVIRYPEHVAISAPVAAVAADGVARPPVAVTIFDQFGQPLEDAEVTLRFNGPQARGARLTGRTDPRGVATVTLPPSARPGYALCQALTERLASPQVRVLYAELAAPTRALRDIAGESRAQLAWDPGTRTASLMGSRVRLQVRAGDDMAWLDGERIPLGQPARLVNGRLEVPALFADTFLP